MGRGIEFCARRRLGRLMSGLEIVSFPLFSLRKEGDYDMGREDMRRTE